MAKILTELRAVLLIVALCVLSAVLYGVVHDQITARICVEYFTIGHPPVFDTESPTLLGIGWGIIATWWVGFILACPLVIAARWGKRPSVSARELIRPIAILFVATGVCAVIAGFVGRTLAIEGIVHLGGALAERVPQDRHVAFLTDAFAHTTSYLIGLFGGIIVIVRTWWRRRMLAGNVG